MNKVTLKSVLISLIFTVLTACTSTGDYFSMQDKLLQHMDLISQLDQQLLKSNDSRQREKLLLQLQKAIRDGIALLRDVQLEKIAANKACIEEEKYVPQGDETCFEEESLEDTRVRMMVMLMEQMTKPYKEE